MKNAKVIVLVWLVTGLLVACGGGNEGHSQSSGDASRTGGGAASGRAAKNSPAAVSPAGSPEECLQRWAELADDMISEGYATVGHFADDNFTEWIDAAIEPSNCAWFQGQKAQLAAAGCELDEAADLARGLSESSEATYRKCQRLYPDDWDTVCRGKYYTDQDMSKQHRMLLAAQEWWRSCR